LGSPRSRLVNLATNRFRKSAYGSRTSATFADLPKSVAKAPGSTIVTLRPNGLTSCASDSWSASTAHFVAE
jgi:hypothetical protein